MAIVSVDFLRLSHQQVDKDKAAFPAYGQPSSGGVDFEFFTKTNVTKNNRSGGYESEECPGDECPENKTIR